MTSNLFSENPKYCYIEFPQWDWPNHNRRPRYDDFYIPAVPPYVPYKDKPLDKLKHVSELLQTNQYFTKLKDTLKFRLELAGFGKEHVSVSVESGKILKVSAKNNMLSYSNSFTIPNAENYNLANPSAQMNNGLLEISFTAKKEEAQTIKIL